MSDSGTGDRALQVLRNSVDKRTFRQKIAIVLYGQSTIHGNVLLAELAAWAQAFRSIYKPGDAVPHFPAVTTLGGYISYLQDALWERGYDATMINCGVGSTSMISDWAGFFTAANSRNSTSFAQKRPANSWAGDAGWAGDLLFVSGIGYFRCTKGNHNTHIANGERPFPYASGANTRAYQDFRAPVPGGNAAGSAFATTGPYDTWVGTGSIASGKFTVATVSSGGIVVGMQIKDGATIIGIVSSFDTGTGGIGIYNVTSGIDTALKALTGTIWRSGTGSVTVDGTVEWTLEYPGGAAISYPTPGNVFMAGTHTPGYGLDPAGLVRRAINARKQVDADRAIYVAIHAQADVGTTQGLYSAAHQSVAQQFINADPTAEIMIGLAEFKPDATNAIANYATLRAGVADARTALRAANPTRLIHDGPDLAATMGTDGPMGGWSGTGSISSGVLTLTGSITGVVEVGQTVWDGSTAVGTVASFGTGTGGLGTYNLTGGADRASRALGGSGAWLQFDRTHTNGAGNVGPDVAGRPCAGKAVAAAFVPVLPTRIVAA